MKIKGYEVRCWNTGKGRFFVAGISKRFAASKLGCSYHHMTHAYMISEQAANVKYPMLSKAFKEPGTVFFQNKFADEWKELDAS